MFYLLVENEKMLMRHMQMQIKMGILHDWIPHSHTLSYICIYSIWELS